MRILNVINILPWNANSSNRWPIRKITQIKQIVVHQALGTKTAVDTNAYHIGKENHVAKGVGSPHICYHYFIDYPNGEVYQCNALDNITSSVANANTKSVSVCLGGFFNWGQTIGRDGNPTQAQIDSLTELLNYLVDLLKLTKEDVKSHDFAQTPPGKPSCPGTLLNSIIKLYGGKIN